MKWLDKSFSNGMELQKLKKKKINLSGTLNKNYAINV